MTIDQEAANWQVVPISGPVTLYESTEVREVLLGAVAGRAPFLLDLESSGPWDLAGLQLLVSVVASAKRAGLPVRFVQVPGVCREVAERCGLSAWLDEVSAPERPD